MQYETVLLGMQVVINWLVKIKSVLFYNDVVHGTATSQRNIMSGRKRLGI